MAVKEVIGLAKIEDEVRSIDVTVTADNLEDDLFKIYSQLFEGINKDEIVFEELQGGYVNSIQRLSLKKDKTKSLVFRTFGMKFNSEEMVKNFKQMQENKDENANEKQNTGKIDQSADQKPPIDLSQLPDLSEVMFNRITEYKVMNEVSKHGLCKQVYAKYNNGIAYGYTVGVVLNGPLMLTMDFLNEMAHKLAKFHSIKYEIPGLKFKTHFERVMGQMGPAFQYMLTEIDKELGEELNKYPFNEMATVDILIKDEEEIFGLLSELGLGRIVFCHNDSNQKNIIWNPQERTLSFIDLEMTMRNYAVLELGYLFGCYPGHFLYDFNQEFFPNLDYRRKFLKKYLEEFNKMNEIKQTKEEFETEFEDLVIKVNLSVLLFFLRLAMVGKFFDKRPEMFQNNELKQKREEIKHFCSIWSLQIYKLYDELKDDFMKEARAYLENKRKANKETEV